MDSGDGRITTDQLPALNQNPVDVAGAGDSMLITTGMVDSGRNTLGSVLTRLYRRWHAGWPVRKQATAKIRITGIY